MIKYVETKFLVNETKKLSQTVKVTTNYAKDLEETTKSLKLKNTYWREEFKFYNGNYEERIKLVWLNKRLNLYITSII